jgi:hypothetical protein
VFGDTGGSRAPDEHGGRLADDHRQHRHGAKGRQNIVAGRTTISSPYTRATQAAPRTIGAARLSSQGRSVTAAKGYL